MKKIVYTILFTVIVSCTTTKPVATDKLIIPLWFTDPSTLVSLDDNIVFLAKEKTKNIALHTISQDAKYLSDLVEPTFLKEFIDDDNYVYLLYVVERDKLANAINSRIDTVMVKYNENMSIADGTSDILEKYDLYMKCQTIYDDLAYFNELAEKEDLIIGISYDLDRSLLFEKMNMTKEQLVFRVEVVGDIDGLIKDSISKELHNMNYEESDYGLIAIEANLTSKIVDLDNNYVNKYWNLTLSLKDYSGSTKNSLGFKGRESKLNEDALDLSIAAIASEHIMQSLSSILP